MQCPFFLLFVFGRSAWEQEQFKRRTFLGGIWFASPEENILSKLRWADSKKQRQDINGILKVAPVDMLYLKRWAKNLGLEQHLQKAL